MSDNIPEWLRPYCTQNSYTPTEEDIESLDPQSRNEMLLKYFALNYSGGGGGGGDSNAAFKAMVTRSITEGTADMWQGITSIGSGAFAYVPMTSIEIPNSVTSIGNNAFSYCTSLASITIPNSVTSIGSNAFNNCTSLANITIPNSVTSISNSTFYYCPSLTSVTIPNSVTSIGRSAFYYCISLTSVTIPNSVTNIVMYAFDNCSRLTSVTVEAATPPTLGSGAFNYVPILVIYVPAESLDAYKSASGWSNYASKIQAILSD